MTFIHPSEDIEKITQKLSSLTLLTQLLNKESITQSLLKKQISFQLFFFFA